MGKAKDEKEPGKAEDATAETTPRTEDEGVQAGDTLISEHLAAEALRITVGRAQGQAQEEERLKAEAALRRDEERSWLDDDDGRTRYAEVIVESLGPNLLPKGFVSSDPEIIALLDTERGKRLVREVNPEG